MPLQSPPPSWRPEYASGNEAMDRDHQALFAELSGFLSRFRVIDEPQVLARAFDVLVEKCAIHFRSEEALLQSGGYPKLDRHVALHTSLLSKCGQVRASFDTSPTALLELMTGRLFEMIVVHVVSADVDFYPYLQSPGAPPQAPVS